jgi:hypothetical protein
MNLGKERAFRQPRCSTGFTRSELVAVMAMVVLLLLVSFPAMGTRVGARTARMTCVNNLRQVGLAWRMSATGFNDTFPFQIPSFLGSHPLESVPAYQWWQVISNELRTPRILLCPTDSRTPARDFGPLFTSLSVSYSIGLDVGFDLPRTILGGDRNVTGGVTSGATSMDFPPQQAGSINWDLTQHALQGNILQSDGSVHQYDNAGLQQALRVSGGQTNRLLLPNF